MRGVIVVGPAGSGTRITTEVLVRNGCYGDFGHSQGMDAMIDDNEARPPEADVYVIRRSLPHWREWPSLDEIVEFYKRIGCDDIRCIYVFRDERCTIMSQLTGHSDLIKDEEQGRRNMKMAREILGEFEKKHDGTDVEFHYIGYEALCLFPEAIQKYICWCAGIEAKTFLEIINGNKKYG